MSVWNAQRGSIYQLTNRRACPARTACPTANNVPPATCALSAGMEPGSLLTKLLVTSVAL